MLVGLEIFIGNIYNYIDLGFFYYDYSIVCYEDILGFIILKSSSSFSLVFIYNDVTILPSRP